MKGADFMAKESRWVKCQMTCPEDKGEADLLIEWHTEGKKEILNSISCNNPKFKDLSSEDCEWSCWGKISKSK